MELGGSALALGDCTSAGNHFRKADILYNPSQHRSHVASFGVDLGLFSRSWSSHFLWQAGYSDQARAKAEEALELARELAHPFTQTITLAYAAMVNQFLRDVEEVDRLAAATTIHATEHGFKYYLAWSEVLRGWSRAARGAGEEGVAEIRSGIEAVQTMAGVRLPYYRALLAEACGWAGEIDEALLALDAATCRHRKNGRAVVGAGAPPPSRRIASVGWDETMRRCRDVFPQSNRRSSLSTGKVTRVTGGGQSRATMAQQR